MKSKASPFVVAVASVSGGGKTTAVAGLTDVLPNTKALYFDQYDCAGPENMMDWLDKGNNYNEWDLSPLLADLHKLLAEPLDCILLDFPFAYQHARSSPYIDFAIFIDTPLDLALSRRIERDFADASKEEILADILFYAKKGRAAYLQMLMDIKPNSDAVIDGNDSISNIVQTLAEKILEVRGNQMKAVFLDRDGTMGGDGHGIAPEKFTMFDFTPAAIQLLNEAGIKVFLFTNQSRVGRGYFTEEELLEGFEQMKDELKQQSAYLDGIYYCPHHPEQACDCLKPETGMLERARKEHGLNLKECYVVGDNGASDMLAASKAGTRMVLVKTGKGQKTLSEPDSHWPATEPDFIAENLLGAAEWILQDVKRGANA